MLLTRKTIILIWVFLTTCLTASLIGQGKIDSLDQVLKTDLEPRDRILTHNRIARIQINRDPEKALYHRDQMDSLSVIYNDTLGKFLVAAISNIHFYSKGDYEQSEKLLKKQLELATMMSRDDFKTGVNYELSLVKREQGQLDSAVFYANTCYQLIEENPKVPLLNKVLILNHIGSLSQQAYRYTEALKYYFMADSLSNKVENYQVSNSKGEINMSIGGVYLKMQDSILAKSFFTKGLKQYSKLDNLKGQSLAYRRLGEIAICCIPDSTLYWYQKANETAQMLGDLRIISSAQSSLGDYWLSVKNYDKASVYYNEALKGFEELDRKSSIATTSMKVARLEEKRGDYRRALDLVKAAATYYDDTGELSGLHAVNYSQGTLLESLGRYKEAVPFLLNAYDLKDSINNALYNRDITELKLKYESNLKDQEILRQNLQLKEEKNRRIRLWVLAGLISLIASLIFLFMRKQLLYNKNLQEKKSLIQSQKIDQLEKEKKLLNMEAMIQGQEEERIRIAKDLHDGLGGLLSTVKAHFSNIQSEIQKIEKLNVYNRANELVDEACDEVRRISHNLMPGALRLEGLKSAIRSLAEDMDEAHSFTIKVETIGLDDRMEESKEIFIFRIIQEALNNIIKHANAKNVLIQLSETQNEYHFIIEDDGQGFDPLSIQYGLGLKSIQSRIDFLKGTLDIDTKKDVGTTVSWHIPKT